MLRLVARRPNQYPLAFAYIRVLEHGEETASRDTGVEWCIPDRPRRPPVADGCRIEARDAQAARRGAGQHPERKRYAPQFGLPLGDLGEHPAVVLPCPGRALAEQ